MVDEEVVATKLEQAHEYTNDLAEMRGLSKEEYVSDIVIQRAVERTLMNLIQSCIDLAQHVRAANDLSSGGTAKEEIQALGELGIISRDTRQKIEEAVGFRNVLAHRYGEVDHDVVYEVLHEDLHWFKRFQQEVAQWLRDRRS
ncbi:uncharacterized protein YutE (UPF0331/DUF86 family) [Halorubrum alkaliphilum]|uniref:Uncharacterized protein YutE (UPF0331/DUF86 family) n=1 Tax=Halorubrum alkaliphilum TaxID=261290 RepID=A0A8T4GGR4_9EURY|nr:DUF86 domain-containing protein [Halorubrum alkaliphilum]MBP1923724.1 uncharacterized protein YutE (UPF0331/DUF86 family) [Halorubrum alkaliphilum]